MNNHCSNANSCRSCSYTSSCEEAKMVEGVSFTSKHNKAPSDVHFSCTPLVVR
ncbi:hypothetical protein HanRHA438_Chr14g0681781 [Helianthus annuus]|nr:hypothetical protein HanIR_Chr14g0727421 [Helianthus annuus]KAJ0856206.1 hypothetical protein HanRHA438_Chr14g0681781 [Helianthus annuus]